MLIGLKISNRVYWPVLEGSRSGYMFSLIKKFNNSDMAVMLNKEVTSHITSILKVPCGVCLETNTYLHPALLTKAHCVYPRA